MKTIEMILHAVELNAEIESKMKSRKFSSSNSQFAEKHLVLLSDSEKNILANHENEEAFWQRNVEHINKWKEQIIAHIESNGILYDPYLEDEPVSYYQEFLEDYNIPFDLLLKRAKEIVDGYQYDVITLRMLCHILQDEIDDLK